ncbi:mannose-1-phosphate guanylyltransferase [Alsobacter metallidurans]|uniref:Mannose-1-phosphate guanylyltransferase n=1 Tax=Alsobacter metallidurans TaxID=340221 RepID=A0A917MF47_9HYPH|nr:nucleotidyltransferase family protein [Alsobacter metallidurans]GGH06078.1 mannose-1-phosphate guanylyltransferase [Alsobacter metallidurans]
MPAQTQTTPDHAMVLAAGLGTRMRPITDTMPKPLVPVAGRALIDHILDPLAEAGVTTAVVNVHYRADQMEDHLRDRRNPKVIISDERDQLLDSGGGVRKALPHLGANPFYVLNADSFWVDGPRSNLRRLAEAFDPAVMDIVMLVAATASSTGYDGAGDFLMGADGRLSRRRERTVAPFVYAGVFIVSPTLFADAPEGPFSLNRLFDRAIERERLFGLRLDGLWLHVGTPEGITLAERALVQSAR